MHTDSFPLTSSAVTSPKEGKCTSFLNVDALESSFSASHKKTARQFQEKLPPGGIENHHPESNSENKAEPTQQADSERPAFSCKKKSRKRFSMRLKMDSGDNLNAPKGHPVQSVEKGDAVGKKTLQLAPSLRGATEKQGTPHASSFHMLNLISSDEIRYQQPNHSILDEQVEGLDSLRQFATLKVEREICSFDEGLKSRLFELLREFYGDATAFGCSRHLIPDYCFRMARLTLESGVETAEEINEAKRALMQELEEEIPFYPIMLRVVIPRLSRLRYKIWTYFVLNWAKTPFSAKLYYYVDKLVEAKDTGEVIARLEALERFEEVNKACTTKSVITRLKEGILPARGIPIPHESTLIWEVIGGCFGRSRGEAQIVIGLLNQWGRPQDKRRVNLEIEFLTNEAFQLLEAAKQITSRRYFWNKEIQCQMDKYDITITPRAIKRSWWPDGSLPLFKSVSINGKNLTLTWKSEFDLYFNLFQALYLQGLNPSIEKDAIALEAKTFLDEANEIFTLEEILEKENESPDQGRERESAKTLDKECPCLKLLRLTTIDCMGFGFEYLRELFPSLFQLSTPGGTGPNLFAVEFVKGVSCTISVVSNSEYSVTQERAIDIHLRDDETKKAIANLKFSWTVGLNNERWEGCLEISSYTMYDENYRKALVRILTRP